MKSTLLRIALVGCLAFARPHLAPAADLTEIYQRALRNDPQLREAEANHQAALEAKPQALASLLPQLNVTGSYANDDNSQTAVTLFGTVFQPFATTTKSDIRQWGLELRQTVFRWDQFATLRQADKQVAQAEVDYRGAQQDVIVRAATAYFNVLSAKDTLEAAEASHEAIARQLEQAEKRFEVGLIAITDVEDAKAAADNAAATVIESKRTLATARDQLRELTGDDVTELARPGDDMPLITPVPASEDQWVKAALEQNLALSSARLGADIAHENISVQQSGHLPSLDLVAKRTGTNASATVNYTDPNTGLPASIPGDNTIHDTQIALELTFPIFAGFGTSSKVREAVYRHRAAQERLERTARATERQTRDSYLGVISEISRVQALRQALESSKTALAATEAGYDVGTRTAVDVLLARQRLFDAQTNYARSRYNYVIDVLTLEQAAGTLDDTRVTRVNSWLNQTVAVK